MTISAIVHERRLQRRFDPCYFCQINIACQLSAGLGFKIELLNLVPIHHNDAGLFRVRGVDQHLLCHIVHLPALAGRPKAAQNQGGFR